MECKAKDLIEVLFVCWIELLKYQKKGKWRYLWTWLFAREKQLWSIMGKRREKFREFVPTMWQWKKFVVFVKLHVYVISREYVTNYICCKNKNLILVMLYHVYVILILLSCLCKRSTFLLWDVNWGRIQIVKGALILVMLKCIQIPRFTMVSSNRNHVQWVTNTVML